MGDDVENTLGVTGGSVLAFNIEVDDHPPFTAGVDDWAILSVHVNAVRGEVYKRETDDLDVSVNGMTRNNEDGIAHHVRWPGTPLKLGSTVRITLVETSSSTAPINRYRVDKEVRENPFTEEESRDMRRQDYLVLKREFENK